MKSHGATSEHETQRNRELLQAYREQLRLASYIRRDDILRKVVNTPTTRFFVSEHRAAIVFSRMLRGDQLHSMRPLKREMFFELFRRFLELRKQQPYISTFQAAAIVTAQPAPKFYLTPDSAKVIICKIKKKWYETRQRRH